MTPGDGGPARTRSPRLASPDPGPPAEYAPLEWRQYWHQHPRGPSPSNSVRTSAQRSAVAGTTVMAPFTALVVAGASTLRAGRSQGPTPALRLRRGPTRTGRRPGLPRSHQGQRASDMRRRRDRGDRPRRREPGQVAQPVRRRSQHADRLLARDVLDDGGHRGLLERGRGREAIAWRRDRHRHLGQRPGAAEAGAAEPPDGHLAGRCRRVVEEVSRPSAMAAVFARSRAAMRVASGGATTATCRSTLASRSSSACTLPCAATTAGSSWSASPGRPANAARDGPRRRFMWPRYCAAPASPIDALPLGGSRPITRRRRPATRRGCRAPGRPRRPSSRAAG